MRHGFLLDGGASARLSEAAPRDPEAAALAPTRNRVGTPPAADITRCVGQVPVVRLNRVSSVCASHECFLKLESCNPGGSIKEKNAVYLVEKAESEGALLPGGTIIESSSGNFGVGLAMVGAARGYRVVIVIDHKTTPPFRRMLAAYGAETVELPPDAVDAAGSMQKARIAKARELAQRIPGAWYPCQHTNPDNPDAHAQFTAREIEASFGDTLDAVVVGVSTAGQFMGLARYLRQRQPHLQLVAVDVQGSVILGAPAAPYKMTGVGLSFVPPVLDYRHIAAGYVVDERLAYSMCHALARREGLLLGASTGAIVAAGLAYAKQNPQRRRVLMINPDRGDRYLETIYDAMWLEQHGFAPLMQAHEMEEAVGRLSPLTLPQP